MHYFLILDFILAIDKMLCPKVALHESFRSGGDWIEAGSTSSSVITRVFGRKRAQCPVRRAHIWSNLDERVSCISHAHSLVLQEAA